jgi:glycine betaine/proline transport system ATP-binding protein
MVFITHDLQEALKLGDRIALMRDGRIVQLGTPEEIVGSPADDYVREFVRDVPREQVMTVRRAMRPAPAGDAGSGPAVAPEATVAEAIEAVARAGAPARVVDEGRCVGVVDSDALLGVVAGTDGPREPRPSAGARPGAAPGPGTGVRPEAAPGPGTGVRPEAAPGPSAGARTGTGARPDAAPGPGTGVRPEAAPGPSAGARTGTGARPDAAPGPGTGARPGAGAV